MVWTLVSRLDHSHCSSSSFPSWYRVWVDARGRVHWRAPSLGEDVWRYSAPPSGLFMSCLFTNGKTWVPLSLICVLQKRHVLEEAEMLDPRISALEEDLDEVESSEEEDEEEEKVTTPNTESKTESSSSENLYRKLQFVTTHFPAARETPNPRTSQTQLPWQWQTSSVSIPSLQTQSLP